MSDETTNLEELQNLPAVELIDRVAALNAEQLQALADIETADTRAGNRVTVLRAIEARRAELAEKASVDDAGASSEIKGEFAADAAADQSGVAPVAELVVGAPPAWQSPDYSGPLTIDQANWRSEYIKPARQVRQK